MASTLKLQCEGNVGFIDWLGGGVTISLICRDGLSQRGVQLPRCIVRHGDLNVSVGFQCEREHYVIRVSANYRRGCAVLVRVFSLA